MVKKSFSARRDFAHENQFAVNNKRRFFQEVFCFSGIKKRIRIVPYYQLRILRLCFVLFY